jgi:hypothetical protein
VTLREIFVENFAGDLEYHPRRAIVYLMLAVAAFCFWVFSRSDVQFTTVPLVFALGSLALLIKGILLLRKSSEGLGLSNQELARLSDPSNRKGFPSITPLASQVVQDFGTGSFLLWPILNLGKDIDKSWSDPPLFRVFLVGAILFFLGWAVRRVASSDKRLSTPVLAKPVTWLPVLGLSI